MADFIITIPDDKVSLVADAIAARYNYDLAVSDLKEEEKKTKIEFAKDIIKNEIRSIVHDYQRTMAINSVVLEKLE